MKCCRNFCIDFVAFPCLIICAGLGGALAVWGFRLGFSALETFFLGSDHGLVAAARALPEWRRVLTPFLGAAAAGLILHAFERRRSAAAKRPSSDYIESVVVGDGRLDMAATLVTCAASLLVVSCGLAVGREGAMILLAALLGSLFSYLLPGGESVPALPAGNIPPENMFSPMPPDGDHAPQSRGAGGNNFPRRGPGQSPGLSPSSPSALTEKRRILVACGAAAGMAAAYHAPLGGVFFVAEVLTGGRLSLRFLGPVALAAFCSRLLTGALAGFSPLYAVPSLPEPGVAFYALLGGFALLCGGAGAGLLVALERSRSLFVRVAVKLGAPRWLRLGAGGLMVGLLSLAYPEVWGNGASTVQMFLHAPPGTLTVCAILLAKLCAMLASNGGGAPGGVLTPTLFVGTAFGLALAGAGDAAGSWLPPVVPIPGEALPLFALCGMACVLAATTHAPLMAAFMTAEFTGAYDLLPALLFACLLASGLSERLRSLSVYGRPV